MEELAEDNDTTEKRRRDLLKRMHKYCDDKNCHRILEELGIVEREVREYEQQMA